MSEKLIPALSKYALGYFTIAERSKKKNNFYEAVENYINFIYSMPKQNNEHYETYNKIKEDLDITSLPL